MVGLGVVAISIAALTALGSGLISYAGGGDTCVIALVNSSCFMTVAQMSYVSVILPFLGAYFNWLGLWK